MAHRPNKVVELLRGHGVNIQYPGSQIQALLQRYEDYKRHPRCQRCTAGHRPERADGATQTPEPVPAAFE